MSVKLISATVIVPYTTSDMPAMTANVLTTPVFVMGEKGVGMIGMIALLTYRDATRREIIRTSGFGGYEVVGEWNEMLLVFSGFKI